jgi:hypothetical protein
VLRLPDIHPLIDADYVPYDVGVMGELDVRIVAELFGGPQIAAALSPAWKGGIYYAAQRKSAVTDAQKQSTASLGLLYYSKWANEDSAHSFARIYSGQLPRKYSGLARRNKDELSDIENTAEEVYTTSEGDVLISTSGTGVFIAEGFDLALARKLRDSILSVQSDAPLQVAQSLPQQLQINSGSPALSLAQFLSGFGVVNAALR